MTSPTFDIETAPLTPDELAAQEPKFEGNANTKDPEKIAAQIEEKRRKWYEQAALSPLTGRIVAIGYALSDDDVVLHTAIQHTEAQMIDAFVSTAQTVSDRNGHLFGYNIVRFDLPFIVRRAWALGVPVPRFLLPGSRYWPDLFVDLADRFCFGNREDMVSLDVCGAFLGCGRKNGSGKHFAAMISEDPERAIEYLRNDVLLTRKVGQRLGLIAEEVKL